MEVNHGGSVQIRERLIDMDGKIDLVWGAEEIAKIIGRTQRVTFHLLATGQLPAMKVGNRWVAERGALLRFFLEPETKKADARA
ncbi:hypothetical protein [Rhizobium sp.]|uniref:hypothetical protein n=1 Tax=Rhizobium sp. TaxID=391 RepID=UPI002AA785E4